uniref:Putative purine permease pediculus us corporis purine permease n=1 Tax=Ixodes ricinus TaxID=34613 RepID=V5H1N1_IXORI
MLGLQHYLIVTSGALSYPFALAPALCMREEDPARGYLISTIFFISGIGTLIQTTFGIRLPIIQGCSVTFLVPILATMGLPEWRCPTEEQLVAARPPRFRSRHGSGPTDRGGGRPKYVARRA